MEQANNVSKLKAKFFGVFCCVFENRWGNFGFVTSSLIYPTRHHVNCGLRLTGYEHVYYYVIRVSPVTQQLPFIAQYGGHAAL